MTKFKTKILNILSFGLLNWIAKRQITKQNQNPSTEIKSAIEFDFDVIDLLKALGDATNIKECTNTINTVIFKIDNKQLIDKNALNKFKAKGILINESSVNIIFGDASAAISQKINTLLNRNVELEDSKIINLIQNSDDQILKISDPSKDIEIPDAPKCVDNEQEIKQEEQKEAEDFVIGGSCDD